MPLPVVSCAADIPSDVCCDTWWLIGERIRTIACNAVCSCVDPDCADRPFATWQSEGSDVDEPLGESLVVSFVSAELRTDTEGFNSRARPWPVTRVIHNVDLRENNWPIQTRNDLNQVITVPDPAIIHGLTKIARGHAEKMWRALVDASTSTSLERRMFTPAANPHIMERGISISAVRPHQTMHGPQAGYRIVVAVDHQLL